MTKANERSTLDRRTRMTTSTANVTITNKTGRFIGCTSGYPGGDGGGLAAINAISVVIDGPVTANGDTGYGCSAGSGSGGTVNITATTVSGTGTIRANGGAGEVGGGGGRIAVYGDRTGFTGAITAGGGDGNVDGHPARFTLNNND